MGVILHRADHPEALVDRLCDILEDTPSDPLRPEVVSVPTRGIERWLAERIATTLEARGIGDGISANIEFPFPRSLFDGVLSRVPAAAPSMRAWNAGDTVLAVASLIDDYRSEPWMRLIDRFIEGRYSHGLPVDSAQRLRAARKIERLFDNYQRRRPAMVRAWSGGDDVGPSGNALPGAAAWQPRLWRLLVESMEVAPPLAVREEALEALAAGDVELDLPERLSVYGLTAMNPADLAVLKALASARDVHLFLLHPSPALWDGVEALLTGATALPRRADDPSRIAGANPILRAWAQDSRELQVMLAHHGLSASSAAFGTREPPSSLLAAIQADIRANEHVVLDEVASGDRSLQIHSCHGTQRQVEVLRDAILHVLADDPTLEPRDVVIMTPDLETFAPLIEAQFPAGQSSGDALPDLRVRIADRAPSQRNPLVRFAATLLDLAGSRLAAGDVRDLILLPVVQRRFRLDADTIGEMEDLIEESNIRWGLDGDHRLRAGAGDRDEHTWRRGMDRVLAGVFFGDDAIRTVEGVSPVPGIEGDSARAAGRLAHVHGRLSEAVRLLQQPRPASWWPLAVSTAVRMLAAPGPDEQWQWSHLERLLDEELAPATEGAVDPVLGFEEARVVVSPWGDDKPSWLHHRTGDITVCTLVPMRSVPYRVVCLLGMDADRFPRSNRMDGEDLLIDDEVVGDNDRGARDRQLLLDSLMAAGEHLIIVYAGRDELTNAEYPPAVPIAEILDVIEEKAGHEAREAVVTTHPLQSFSSDIFLPGRLHPERPWGFSPMQHRGALGLAERAPQPAPAGPLMLPRPERAGDRRLDDMITFYNHPARTFLRTRLGMRVPALDERPDDELPIELGPLGVWGVANRMIEGLRQGLDIDDMAGHEVGADAVPSGALATAGLEQAAKRARSIFNAAVSHGFRPEGQEHLSAQIETPSFALSGSVTVDPEEALVTVLTPSRTKAKDRLALYLRVLFLTVHEPERPWRGLMISRGYSGFWMVNVNPPGDNGVRRYAAASRRLIDLVSLWDEGLEQPVPIFSESSYAYATSKRNYRDQNVDDAWMPGYFRFSPESEDPAHRLLFPGLVTVEDLYDSEFPLYAERVWKPFEQMSEGKRP